MVEILLITLDRKAIDAFLLDTKGFASAQGVRLEDDGDFAIEIALQTRNMLLSNHAEAPWCGYFTLDRECRAIVGACGFKGEPSPEGEVEIGYCTVPQFEGQGYATAMARELIRIAFASGRVRSVTAHTLPHAGASSSVLEKAGMRRTGTVVDPEDGEVWEWKYLHAELP